MGKFKRIERTIPLDKLCLDLRNPRHIPCTDEREAIQHLCDDEQIWELAKDIAAEGLNPLVQFAVIRGQDGNRKSYYIVGDGNRRVCALKILTKPGLAPWSGKTRYEDMAKGWTPITELPCVIFEDMDDLHLWRDRNHHGPAGGKGQKPWNSEQKARDMGERSPNRMALKFLDYAEVKGWISHDKRRGKLTTVQRYLSNLQMQKALGLPREYTTGELLPGIPDSEFRSRSRRFIFDLLDGKIHSRHNKVTIDPYAHQLGNLVEVVNETVEKKEKYHSRKPKSPPRLPERKDISQALENLGNRKLISLYHSICHVGLQKHTPLLAVGVWIFFEASTAIVGRDSSTDFYSFLSLQKMDEYGMKDKRKKKILQRALQRIKEFSNTTKHDGTAAAFNSDQLHNDMDTLGDLILKIIQEAIQRKSQREE